MHDEISAGRIGQPVSVRAYLELTADHGKLRGELAHVGALAMDWLGDKAKRVCVLSTTPAEQLCALIEGEGGATALLTTSPQRNPTPLVDLLILGNRGTIIFDGASIDGPTTTSGDGKISSEDRAPRGQGALLRAIDDSLRTRNPSPVATSEDEN